MTPEQSTLVARLDTATIMIGGIPTRLDIFDEAAACIREMAGEIEDFMRSDAQEGKLIDSLRATLATQAAQIKALEARIDNRHSITAEGMAIWFHETYERLAPLYGYETRPDTKQFDPQSKNGKLMVAVCEEWLSDSGIDALMTERAKP